MCNGSKTLNIYFLLVVEHQSRLTIILPPLLALLFLKVVSKIDSLPVYQLGRKYRVQSHSLLLQGIPRSGADLLYLYSTGQNLVPWLPDCKSGK